MPDSTRDELSVIKERIAINRRMDELLRREQELLAPTPDAAAARGAIDVPSRAPVQADVERGITRALASNASTERSDDVRRARRSPPMMMMLPSSLQAPRTPSPPMTPTRAPRRIRAAAAPTDAATGEPITHRVRKRKELDQSPSRERETSVMVRREGDTKARRRRDVGLLADVSATYRDASSPFTSPVPSSSDGPWVPKDENRRRCNKCHYKEGETKTFKEISVTVEFGGKGKTCTTCTKSYLYVAAFQYLPSVVADLVASDQKLVASNQKLVAAEERQRATRELLELELAKQKNDSVVADALERLLERSAEVAEPASTQTQKNTTNTASGALVVRERSFLHRLLNLIFYV